MTNNPIINKTICTGIVTFVLSMAVLGVVNLCCDFFDAYLSMPLCVLISLLVTAVVVCITWLWLRLRQLEEQTSYLRGKLYAMEKKQNDM